MAVETRVIIDANASNAIKEIGKLDEAAQAADETIKALDDQTVTVETNTDGMDELRRMGEDAIAQVKALDDQQVSIDVDSSGLDTVKQKADAVETSGRAGSVAIGGIGNSISELPGIGAMGPLAESFGQLAETALEGEANISQITSAIGVLGGTALVMKGIQTVMQNIADTKAFNAEKAKAFKEAIDDVGDSTRAVLDVIKETQSVTGRSGGLLGSGVLQHTQDITEQLDKAGVSVEDFALAVQKGGAPLDEAVGKLEAMKTAAEDAFKVSLKDEDRQKILDYNGAIEILKETHKTYSDQVSGDESWSHWIEGGDTAKATGDAWNTTLQEGIGWLTGTSDSMRGTTDRTKDLAAGYEEARRKADDLTYANQALRGDLDQQGAYLRLQAQFDETKRRGTEAMDAVKNKSSDADSKMRDYELSVIDSKTAVMDFNTEWGNVTLDQQLTMNTEIDRGEFDQVIVDVGKATSTTHWIDVRVRTTVDQAWERVMGSRI